MNFPRSLFVVFASIALTGLQAAEKQEKFFSSWQTQSSRGPDSEKWASRNRDLDGNDNVVSVKMIPNAVFRIDQNLQVSSYKINKGEIFFSIDKVNDVICDMKVLSIEKNKGITGYYKQICFVDSDRNGSFDFWFRRSVGSRNTRDEIKSEPKNSGIYLFNKISLNEVPDSMYPYVEISYVDHFNVNSFHEFIVMNNRENVLQCNFSNGFISEHRFHIKDSSLSNVVDVSGMKFHIKELGMNKILLSIDGDIKEFNVNCF